MSGTLLTMKGGQGMIYNKSIIPGNITKIELTGTTSGNSVECYGYYAQSGRADVLGAIPYGEKIGAGLVFDFTGKDYRWFSLRLPNSSTLKFAELKIYYQPTNYDEFCITKETANLLSQNFNEVRTEHAWTQGGISLGCVGTIYSTENGIKPLNINKPQGVIYNKTALPGDLVGVDLINSTQIMDVYGNFQQAAFPTPETLGSTPQGHLIGSGKSVVYTEQQQYRFFALAALTSPGLVKCNAIRIKYKRTGAGLSFIPATKAINVYFDGTRIHNPENIQLKIYNTSGILMDESKNDINIEEYKCGIYIIRTTNGKRL